MGLVYRAVDRNLGRDVVIKTPRLDILATPAAARFTREIRSLVALVHPHIVHILDAGEHEGVPFVVLEYLAGGSLQSRRPVGPHGRPLPMPVQTLSNWLDNIATVLDFIHGQHHVHRDVKPDNILFDSFGSAYLSDFGITKAMAAADLKAQATALTSTGVAVGSPPYMAPELVKGEPYDGRVDQYALAVTIYELLSGTNPFTAAYPAAVLMRHTTHEPPPLHEVVPTISEVVATAVQRGLAKDPQQRYTDCRSLACAVLSSLNGATLEFDVTLPAAWRLIPGTHAHLGPTVATTPGRVVLRGGEHYAIQVERSVTDATLTGLRPLARLPGLKEINLRWCDQITDAGIAHLGCLPRLNAISVRGCVQMTDAGLDQLAALSQLESLDISYCPQVTDWGLERLRQLVHLESLSLSGCSGLTEAGLLHLHALPCLKTLHLGGPRVTDAWLVQLQALPQLRVLSLGESEQLTDAGVAHLGVLQRLAALDVSSCKRLTDAGLANLAALSRLERLTLFQCPALTDEGLAHLASLTHLEALDLGWCQKITDVGLRHLRSLSYLEALDLSGCYQVTDAGLESLQALPRLQRLDLRRCGHLTNAGLAHLAELRHLKSLSLGACNQISDTGLTFLKALTHLEELDLRECDHITDAGLAHLHGLTRLSTLTLFGCPQVSAAGRLSLQAAAPGCAIRHS